jgi:hypothetical protein
MNYLTTNYLMGSMRPQTFYDVHFTLKLQNENPFPHSLCSPSHCGGLVKQYSFGPLLTTPMHLRYEF